MAHPPASGVTSPPIPLTHFTGWLAYGERGLSSEAIVQHLTGNTVGRHHFGHGHHPHDPSDFRRCQLLLNAIPLARLMFPSMRTVSPEWARLVDAWDEIHETIEREAPDYLAGRQGAAPNGYRLLRRVIAGGVICDSCTGTGNAEACSKCKGTGRRSGGRCRATGCYRGHHYCPTCRGNGYTIEGEAA